MKRENIYLIVPKSIIDKVAAMCDAIEVRKVDAVISYAAKCIRREIDNGFKYYNEKMNAEKQIEEAAKCYKDGRKASGIESDITLDEIDDAYHEGANFGIRLAEQEARKECDAAFYLGLRHRAPQWHKIDKSDPLQPDEGEDYLCYDGFFYFVGRTIAGEWYSSNEGNQESPIAWCRFQRAPEDK